MDRRLNQMLKPKKDIGRRPSPRPPINRVNAPTQSGPPSSRNESKDTAFLLSTLVNMPYTDPLSTPPANSPSSSDDDDIHLSSVRSSDYEDDKSLSDSSISRNYVKNEITPVRSIPRVNVARQQFKEPEPPKPSLIVTLQLPSHKPNRFKNLRAPQPLPDRRNIKKLIHSKLELASDHELRRVSSLERSSQKTSHLIKPEHKEIRAGAKPIPIPPRVKPTSSLSNNARTSIKSQRPDISPVSASPPVKKNDVSTNMSRSHTNISHERHRIESSSNSSGTLPNRKVRPTETSVPISRNKEVDLSKPPNLHNVSSKLVDPSARPRDVKVKEELRPLRVNGIPVVRKPVNSTIEHSKVRSIDAAKRNTDELPSFTKKIKISPNEKPIENSMINRVKSSNIRDKSPIGTLSKTSSPQPSKINDKSKTIDQLTPASSLPYLDQQVLPTRFHPNPPSKTYLDNLSQHFNFYHKTAQDIYYLGKKRLSENETEAAYLLYLEAIFFYIKAFYYQELVGTSDTIKYIHAWETLLGIIDKCSSYFSEAPAGAALLGVVHYLKVFVCNRLTTQAAPYVTPSSKICEQSVTFYYQLQEHMSFSMYLAQTVLSFEQVQSHFPDLYSHYRSKNFQDFPPRLPPKDNPDSLIYFGRHILTTYCAKNGIELSSHVDDPKSAGLTPLDATL